MNIKNKLPIFQMTTASFFFALTAVFVKSAPEIPVSLKVFCRGSLMFLFALFFMFKHKISFNHLQKRYLIARSVTGTTAVFLFFFSIEHLSLADSAILNKLSPFFVLLFCSVFLEEKLHLLHWAAIFSAFAGASMIIKPSLSVHPVATAAGLASAALAGAAYTFIRKISGQASPHQIILYFGLISTISTLPLIIIQSFYITAKSGLMLFLSSLSAVTGQFFLTRSYQNSKASEVSIFLYTNVIFSAVFGWLIWENIPDILSFSGFILILGGAFINQTASTIQNQNKDLTKSMKYNNLK